MNYKFQGLFTASFFRGKVSDGLHQEKGGRVAEAKISIALFQIFSFFHPNFNFFYYKIELKSRPFLFSLQNSRQTENNHGATGKVTNCAQLITHPVYIYIYIL